jgi:hypothetical protein
MKLSWWKTLGGFVLTAMLSVPAWAANAALPGTLNYVEGQANVGGQSLNAKQIGSVELQPGQKLDTDRGKAEILLTPGVFLRVGNNGAAQLVSSSLTNTEARINEGQAMVEVAEIHKDNLLRIASNGATTQLLKVGLYGFDADSGAVRVFKGEALVQHGEQQVKVKGGHEVDLNTSAKLKSRKFDKKSYEQSDLYRFSNLRSEYLAEANVDIARTYYAGGPGWSGPGWYWDPFFTSYTWIPGNGILYSPFGWGFYSPGLVSYAPIFYRGGYYPYRVGRYPYYGHPGGGHWPRPVARPTIAAPRPAAGFHPGAPGGHMGVRGGGFHGGSGGFHSSPRPR